MASEWREKIKESWTGFTDSIEEQVWYQELKQKWEELDPQSRFYAKAASVGGTLLCIVVVVISSMWGVYKLKRDFAEKSDLLSTMQAANDELRRLKDANASAVSTAVGENAGPWSPYLESVAAAAGLDRSTLEIGAEKPGNNTDSSKEALLDVTLKHVSIKQVVRLAFQLENGARPMKLRNLSIDTQSDPTGYMNATLAVSGFTLVSK
jgi:hypothetical protein